MIQILYLIFLYLDAEPGVRFSGSKSAAKPGNKKPSKMAQIKDGASIVKVEGMVYDFLLWITNGC